MNKIYPSHTFVLTNYMNTIKCTYQNKAKVKRSVKMYELTSFQQRKRKHGITIIRITYKITSESFRTEQIVNCLKGRIMSLWRFLCDKNNARLFHIANNSQMQKCYKNHHILWKSDMLKQNRHYVCNQPPKMITCLTAFSKYDVDECY